MFQIVCKTVLTPSVSLMKLSAPSIVKHAKPGQFVVIRIDADSERIPFTIAEANQVDQTISIIFQVVGASTLKLNQLKENDYILDCVGPLGKPSQIEGLNRVCVIGGGLGCAIAYPIAKALHDQKTYVHSIIGFRQQDLVFLSDEFKAISDEYELVTDDGSSGKRGLVTTVLKEILNKGDSFDEVIAIGPLVMMKAVCELTKNYGIKTIVSMNPIMIDGTGMCGGCRITVNKKMKFACVDGPEFDGHLVDFDEAILRNRMYQAEERKAYDHQCRLLKEVQSD